METVTVATWWSSQTEQAAEGSRYFSATTGTRKGSFGSECFHFTCKSGGANWYHKGTARYYCEACAGEINTLYKQEGLTRACSRHV